jgi:hypothetical protein
MNEKYIKIDEGKYQQCIIKLSEIKFIRKRGLEGVTPWHVNIDGSKIYFSSEKERDDFYNKLISKIDYIEI